MDGDKDSLEFAISRPAIVDRVMMGLFFHPEENKKGKDTELIIKANTMKLFQLQEDGSYVVVIKNSLRFDLAIQHVSVGLSFRQTTTVMTQYQNACKIPKLAGINDHMVGQFVRILLAVGLQVMSDVINHPFVWAFSLAADCSTHMGVPLLDQRIRVCVHGVLYNLHLVLVPFFERHTAQNYVKLIKVLLNSLSPIWRDKAISISSDGENTMTGRYGGVVTLLEQECLNPVLRIMQRKFLSNLMVELTGSFICMSTSDIQLDELDHTTIIVRGNWLIEKESAIMHIHNQGSLVRDLHSSLSNFNQQSTLEEVATFVLCIVADGLQIQDMIDLIEIQHRELIVVYGREPDVKAALDTHDEKTYFNDA
ncbi:hypothetical protein BASA60_004335 [Batrachochytrium salamandrivorans]|nr:hypothetical protein BASA60_004335 [Batrachochytrium salamandrivorans]